MRMIETSSAFNENLDPCSTEYLDVYNQLSRDYNIPADRKKAPSQLGAQICTFLADLRQTVCCHFPAVREHDWLEIQLPRLIGTRQKSLEGVESNCFLSDGAKIFFTACEEFQNYFGTIHAVCLIGPWCCLPRRMFRSIRRLQSIIT